MVDMLSVQRGSEVLSRWFAGLSTVFQNILCLGRGGFSLAVWRWEDLCCSPAPPLPWGEKEVMKSPEILQSLKS